MGDLADDPHPASALEQFEPLARPGQKQYVAHLERDVGDLDRVGMPAPVQRDDRNAVSLAEPQLAQGPTAKDRPRHEDRLGKRLLISRELSFGLLHRRLEPNARQVVHLEQRLAGPDDDQHVAGGETQLRRGPKTMLAAVNREHGDAAIAEAGLGQQLAFGLRPGLDLELRHVGVDRVVARIASRRPGGQKNSAEHHHQQDPGDGHRQADRQELEQAEGLEAHLLQQCVGRQIRRGPEQGRRAAQHRRVGQGHQQPARALPGLVGVLHHRRQHDRGDVGVAQEGRKPGADRHHHGQRPRLDVTGESVNGAREDVHDAGSRQSARQHEDRAEDEDELAGKSGEDLARREDAADHEDQRHAQRDDVDAEPLGR